LNVGLTQTILHHNERAYDSIESDWYRYLKGHTLFCVRNDINQDFAKLASNLDILIITGGVDYANRRAVELKLASLMMQQFKPVLGVCHGSLLMTDILGGLTIENTAHLNTEHDIIYMDQKYKVNSFHSNIITVPHQTATVLATDMEGHCEAWIDDNIAGIMWHPQRMEEPFLPTEIANKFQL